ncbi:threonine--tRNA ligase [Candidatus Saccharibacteria bacterium]|nr:threonine--tRNA ligase [Candidatus Saccharibacteria bacterium]
MNQDQLYAMRHSLAHITAQAVQRLWPGAKFGVGPVVENGFYYDIDVDGVKISEDDFPKIEKEMRKVIASDYTFDRSEKAVDDAISWAQEQKQPYKEELLNDLRRAGTTIVKDLDIAELGLAADGGAMIENVSFYTDGDFTDLCRGPHSESTGKVGAFKLMRVAGAYWRGKETNPQMQRLYGVAFASQQELDEHLTMLEEAKKRDHRKLGQELDLFTFSDLVGAGLPLWTPRGTLLKNMLDNYVQELRDNYGFQQVSIPHITKKELYERSGHWAKFKDELFRITTREDYEFAMKPMNCPHHTQIYAAQPRSYRDLPIRYRETTMVYRDEQSGELGGLSRVRGITQDDAHIFCRVSQVEVEAVKVWDIIETLYGSLGFGKLNVRLSTHDPESMGAYAGDEEKWKNTVEQLRNIITAKIGDDYIMGVGEAAFYGPKIDFMAKDAIGREHQLATIQLDFNQPEGFDLKCTNEQGEAERVVMIHCAILGSHERFLSVFIEHTAGWFPFWSAPEQLRILTINNQVVDYVAEVKQVLDRTVLMRPVKYNELRYTVDDRNESLGKKIREATRWKIPVQLIIGPKDAEAHEVSVRMQTGEEKVALADLRAYLEAL